MSFHFITYGDHNYEKSKIRIRKEAENFGIFKTITCYGPADLDNGFKTRYKHILAANRGGGYWLWKPYLIHKRINEIDNGDYLVYLDCGCTINKNGLPRFYEYIKMLNDSEYGCLTFQLVHLEINYTKRQVFEYFQDELSSDILNTGQIMGTVLIFKKGEHSKRIITEWYNIAMNNPELYTDETSIQQYPAFKDHRHDQSILSIICKLRGSVVLQDETWFKDWRLGMDIPFLATRIKG